MLDMKRLKSLQSKLTYEIESGSKGLLARFPLDQYIGYLNKYPKVADYKHVSKSVKLLCDRIIKTGDERTLELYHKLLLVTLIIRAERELKGKDLPEEIKGHYESHFESIIDRIESDDLPLGTYQHSLNTFCMDLSICVFRMIPIGGGRKMYLARFPIRVLYNHGWRQFIKGLYLVVFKLKGIQPLYMAHLDTRDEKGMAGFTPEGQVDCYRNKVALFKRNKEVKGFWGETWFYDPRVKEISPRLGYVLDFNLDTLKGAHFYGGTGEGVTKHAIATSSTRKKLYEEGKYIPTNYIMVHTRKRLIEWASQYTG